MQNGFSLSICSIYEAVLFSFMEMAQINNIAVVGRCQLNSLTVNLKTTLVKRGLPKL